MNQGYHIALLGIESLATETLLELLSESEFPVAALYPLSGGEGEREPLRFAGKSLRVNDPDEFAWSSVQLLFILQDLPDRARWSQEAADAGVLVIDASGAASEALRQPAVNEEAVDLPRSGVVALPSSLGGILASVLKPLHDEAGIARASVVALCPASECGPAGIQTLARETAMLLNGRPVEEGEFPAQVAFNLLPQVTGTQGRSLDQQVEAEIAALLEDKQSRIEVRCIQAPTFYGHAVSLQLEMRYPCDFAEVRAAFEQVAELELVDAEMVTPVSHGVGNSTITLYGLKQSEQHEQALSGWLVCDNLRRGIAYAMVATAEQWHQLNG